MKKLSQNARELLAKERVCVLAVSFADGTPHAAEVHYSQVLDSTFGTTLYMQTYPTKKVEAIEEQDGVAKAAIVVGLEETPMVSLQMHGRIEIVTDPVHLDQIYRVHYSKHPSAEQYKDADSVFLAFTPTWWRYSDFNTDPETIEEGS